MNVKNNINLNYLGSKETLLSFIETTIKRNNPNGINSFCDLFSGSGIVARHFAKKNIPVFANDVEAISTLSLKVLISQHNKNKFKKVGGLESVFNFLNNLNGKTGFFTENYSPNEIVYNRMYFTVKNAKKIDSIRFAIENLYKEKKITEEEFNYLLFCLVKAVEKIANTAAIYEAYLKKFKSAALNDIFLKPIKINNGFKLGKTFSKTAETLIHEIKGNILYLDPPYNRRQYSSNYHILNTLVLNDKPKLKGKTGNRLDNFKSGWCQKTKAASELEHIVKNAKFNQIYMSYNCEGVITPKKIKEIFSKYGKYKVYTKKYKRFKSQKTSNKNFVTEYIHCLIKD